MPKKVIAIRRPDPKFVIQALYATGWRTVRGYVADSRESCMDSIERILTHKPGYKLRCRRWQRENLSTERPPMAA